MPDRHLVRPPHGTRPAHDMGHPGRTEPDLGVTEPLVNSPEDMVVRHECVAETQFAVAPEHRPVDGPDVTDDVDPVGGRRHHKHGGTAGATRFAARARHGDEERRAIGPGDEPLPPVDDPASVDLARGRHQHRRVSACARRRFRHGEGRTDLAARQRLKVAFRWSTVATLSSRWMFPSSGRRCSTPAGRTGVAGLLEDRRTLDHGEAEAPAVNRCMRSEDSCGAGSGLKHAPCGLPPAAAMSPSWASSSGSATSWMTLPGLLDQQVYCSAVHSGLLRPSGAVAASGHRAGDLNSLQDVQ